MSRANGASSTWTPAKAALVCLHWGSKTARQIGEMIGMNRNQVIGKAHRLGLTAKMVVSGEELSKRQRNGLRAAQARKRKPRIKRKLGSYSGADGCQWLEDEPHDRNFCGAPIIPGSSYCEAHHKRCWIRPENYRSEAA